MLERDGVGSVRTIIAWLGSGCTYVHCYFFEVPRCGPDSTERAPASEDREVVENGKLENHYYDDDDDYSGHASPLPLALPTSTPPCAIRRIDMHA
jgi:hypothetical protein